MTKDELRKMLKPLIKECIKEVFFEPGMLSTVIKEVLRGTESVAPLVESRQRRAAAPPPEVDEDVINEEREHRRKKINETRQKLLNSIGKDAFKGVDIFEGTAPLSKAGSVSESQAPGNPLSIYEPDNPGVDISKLGIFGKKRSV